MYVFGMEQHECLSLDERTELARWLKSERLFEAGIVEIRATCQDRKLELVGLARNAEGKRFLDPVTQEPATIEFVHYAKSPPPIPLRLWLQPTTMSVPTTLSESPG